MQDMYQRQAASGKRLKTHILRMMAGGFFQKWDQVPRYSDSKAFGFLRLLTVSFASFRCV